MNWLRFLTVLVVLIAYHLILYYGVQYLEGKPRTVGWAVDQKIPYRPGFIYIYCSWFVALAAVPALLYLFSAETFVRYCIAYALNLTVSDLIFLFVPTTFTRPDAPQKGLTGFAVRTVYGANHRFLNCAPSVHCSMAMQMMLCALACPGCPGILKAAVSVWGALIVVSTLFVKQHVLLDALTAIPVALACWGASYLFNVPNLVQILGL